jgi:RNA polymerase sigma-70 factor, ECF subfamily
MTTVSEQLEEIFKLESRKILATLIRIVGDFDLAEEAMQEAFATALKSWPESGIPGNPSAWLISTGRFRAIDKLRRKKKLRELEPVLAQRWEEVRKQNEALGAHEVTDDRLRLIFTCCHPAIAPKIQVPLTLREVCGLSTEEVARAFLTGHSAMAQRIVRGKAKIREAGIPFVVPELTDIPERLDSVLSVVYLIFNEGYSASVGNSPLRLGLSEEAIRLGRLLLSLLPEPEVKGLLALMLLHHSRRKARIDGDGNTVLLHEQDRALWDRKMIQEGNELLADSLGSDRFGSYTLQAAISAVHANSPSPQDTDWPEILALYNLLLTVQPSPVVRLNRSVAVSMVEGPQPALRIVDSILDDGHLQDYPAAYIARGEWLIQLGRSEEGRNALARAHSLSASESERRFLEKKMEQLSLS